MRRAKRCVPLGSVLGALAVAVVHASCGSSAPAPGGGADASAEASLSSLLPVPPDGSPARAGYDFVVQRGCADCHQSPSIADGILSGQSMARGGTTAYGANLTPDPDTGMDAWDVATIARALKQGVDDQGSPLCPPMLHYSDMSDDEASAIAMYLQSLPAAHHPVPKSLCPPLKPAPNDGDAGTDAAVADASADG